jgi:Uma2 family endonuclease
MIQLLPKLITFDEFIEWLPENRHYELHEGIIIEMQPTGQHEDITSFLTQELTLEYMRMNLPYRIPPKALVKLKREHLTCAMSINAYSSQKLENLEPDHKEK